MGSESKGAAYLGVGVSGAGFMSLQDSGGQEILGAGKFKGGPPVLYLNGNAAAKQVELGSYNEGAGYVHVFGSGGGTRLIALSGGAHVTRNAGMECRGGDGDVITVSDRGAWLDFSVSAPPTLAGRLQGLLGDNDGNTGNDLKLRNGELTSNPAQLTEDWRLRDDSESLFTYAAGEGTATFTAAQDCSTTATGDDIEAARQIYRAECATDPPQSILTAIATDLAGGTPPEKVAESVADICGHVPTASIGDAPVVVLSPANRSATYQGTFTAPGYYNHSYTFLYLDSTAFATGTLGIDIQVGSGPSCASFDLYPSNVPPTTQGFPSGQVANTYDHDPGWSGSIGYQFPGGQVFLFGAEGCWFSPAGSTNTFSITAHCDDCQLRCGDVNGDGRVDSGDALAVGQYANHVRSCGEVPFLHPEVCDVTGDGQCTSADANAILACDAGSGLCNFTCGAFTCH